MGADDEVLAGLQTQALEYGGSLNAFAVMVQHLPHVGARLDDGLWPNALGDQVTPCVFGQHKIDVAQVIQYLAVQFFRHTLVEAAIARFHMEHRNLASLGRDHREAGVCVAIQENGVRLFQRHDRVGALDHTGYGLCSVLSGGLEEVVRLADAEVLEEDVVEFVVVVLPGVHQHVPGVCVKRGNDARHLDQLGACAHDGHDLKHAAALECSSASSAAA